MAFSFLHILLAAFGLGFLIFIHELGHYWMARRVGMTVEVFSIGFGKPFYVWEHQGVKWQFCWLPFGGYVRIAGMEKKGNLEPHQIPDGFFGKKPWQRIKVAAIGPLVNLVFAFILFCVLWLTGGRSKPFSEYTRFIGWVEPCSSIYNSGVRSGDEITELNHKPFHSFHDILYASMLDDVSPSVSGWKIDYVSGDKAPFDYAFPVEPKAKGVERVGMISSVLSPAEYLIYTTPPQKILGSPMEASGIQSGDRIVWVDGKNIFSKKELISTINEPKTLLTVQRDQQVFLVRVPRIKISDMRINAGQKSEMDDWQHEAQIKGKVQDLFFIPYDLNGQAVVQQSLAFLNADSREERPCSHDRSAIENPLQAQDKILAVDGITVQSSVDIFKLLQTRHISIIVKGGNQSQPIRWNDANEQFAHDVDWKAVYKIASSIGTSKPIPQLGELRVLQPVEPKLMNDFPLPQELRTRITNEVSAQKKAIDEMEDPQAKAMALRQLEDSQRKVMLGVNLQDRAVTYNPSPFRLFSNAFEETWRTFAALITGYLSPKFLAGPVGMVQVMQYSWSVGVKEAIFWLAVISLNLGVLNLLPIPVLDGGHICFSLWEMITGKPIKSKTMERLIIPFVLVLIALFVYLTFNDISRLFSRFF